jgi:HSP20 family molecular chaperone IbpA
MELSAVNLSAIDILVTTDDVLVQSRNSRHPRIFRAIHFPQQVNPAESHATWVKGKLVLIAPKLTPPYFSERIPA